MDFHMLHQQGLSIRQIAALRGVSHNAVRRALRSPSPPTGKRRREKGCKLKALEPLIVSWLADPVKSQWTARRIFEELQDRGYAGGYTVVKAFVAQRRPRPTVTAEARFFVKAGQQLQVDWAEMGLARVDGVERKLYAFLAVLAWSRAMFVRFTTDMSMLTWLDCHSRAFQFFGGVTAEVLIDNLKTGVSSRAGGTVRWHPKYEEFAVGRVFVRSRTFHDDRKPKGVSSGWSGFCAKHFSKVGRSRRSRSQESACSAVSAACSASCANKRLAGSIDSRSWSLQRRDIPPRIRYVMWSSRHTSRETSLGASRPRSGSTSTEERQLRLSPETIAIN